ncbi:hypothetical protein BASA50_011245 [Batrachochytrium salamandrivorans]|uniref:Molybdopterin synthase sulfur carrier subunit n=1 Tax=Batrachochytrium salamandrivorans TaxID=1357716 RepID=A0ABQ8EX82_9FUNG|nr:hypothetical protein BASA62_006307 [Batrachochytrium salamandrivorans]KAH6582829.1 hypothetical protein BASA60_001725 [Batrachochytrium salamandrivorans]KAH6584217.1 hypothetical protein BASA61_007575 [Batrachochytrium salamandrivorans]KAH6587641.1 hypothetical protein BASA50_011245 [Batrachochytrium salamandrivorans]KAH9247990.1 molybdopterin converting factor, subunit 1 [Batrachochytrium salamandrivorans]
MQVKILFFASCRDLLGIEQDELCFPGESVDVPRLLSALTTKYPALHQILESSMLAVNMSYVDRQGFSENGKFMEIYHGDEVAVIPPVSGG